MRLVLQEQKGSDPLELLQQCEEALGDRPPRFHRKFTYLNDGDSAPSSPIRVMQWNILAQGESNITSQGLTYPTTYSFQKQFCERVKLDVSSEI